MNTLLAAICLLLGVLIGAGVTWLAMHGSHREWERTLEAALPKVAEAVLRPKTEQLEHINRLELKLLGADTVHQVEQSQTGMEAKLEEALKLLAGYQERINGFERERAASQAKLEEQLQQVAGAGAQMAQEARTLRQALATNSGVRGAWGESVLQNILNACGLNQQIDYDLQVELPERLRPDAVLYLPSGRKLAIDAKASLSGFLAGLEAADDSVRRAAFADFAKVLRQRAKELASKDYCGLLQGSLPCMLMFVPSEGAFRAALDADPGLFRYAQELQPSVVLASPSTLFPMIAVVAQGWQQYKATQQMQRLLEEVADLGTRLQTYVAHVQAIGKGLDAAGKAYNAANNSFRARLAPKVEQLQDLNANWSALGEPKELETPVLLAQAASTARED